MNDLGADFIRGLKADFKANGAQMLADLRRNEPRHYFNLIRSLSREDIGEESPQPASLPNQEQPVDPANDPYHKVSRFIAIEKLKKELARLEAEEETETRAAEEALDRRLAEKEAQRDAEAKALAAQTRSGGVR